MKARAQVHELKWEEYQDAEVETYVIYIAKKTQDTSAEIMTAMMYMDLIASGVVTGAVKVIVDTPEGPKALYALKHKRKNESKINQILHIYGAGYWYQDNLRRIKAIS